MAGGHTRCDNAFLLRPGRAAEYCDQSVCLSVCLSVHEDIFVTTNHAIDLQIFYAFYPWPWLDPALVHCDTLCTSGSVDHIRFVRSGLCGAGDAIRA